MLQGTSYRVQGTSYRVQATMYSYRVQASRYKVQSTKYKVQGTRYKEGNVGPGHLSSRPHAQPRPVSDDRVEKMSGSPLVVFCKFLEE